MRKVDNASLSDNVCTHLALLIDYQLTPIEMSQTIQNTGRTFKVD